MMELRCINYGGAVGWDVFGQPRIKNVACQWKHARHQNLHSATIHNFYIVVSMIFHGMQSNEKIQTPKRTWLKNHWICDLPSDLQAVQ
jgi:hypothetical protein